jgi:hypothetical protein
LKNISLYLSVSLVFLFSQCHRADKPAEQNGNQPKTGEQAKTAPQFNADTAFDIIKKQVDFGPRVPNTVAHDACAKYLEAKLRQYTPDVTVQTGDVKAYDGTTLHIKNIIGVLHPEKSRKILICAHWDSRPWADQDSVGKDKPIDAANDAGSGIAVMLEIARQLQHSNPDIGVILLMVDAEDYGNSRDENSYCLGTQYWANHLDKTKYTADYGILLDMVGAANARFLQEAYSLEKAENIVNKIWMQAQASGTSNYFILNHTGGITDDHRVINNLAQIPTVDIIDYDESRPKGFAYYWHTHADNIKIIDKNTLKAVGQTLLDLIFAERGS